MKSAIKFIGITTISILTIVIVITIYGRNARENEMSDNLAAVTEQTIENLMENQNYSIHNYDEFIADFIENLALCLNTDSDITVNVLKADIEKGLLSVQVVEEYTHPNGNKGNVKYSKTVIFNQTITDVKNTYKVCFYLTKEDMENQENCYKEYNITKGDCAIEPLAPTSENGTFAGWKDSNDYLADFAAEVEADISYYATFE